MGVVLAGGQSRRMGRDKAALRWLLPEGEQVTWLTHAVRRLQSCCDQVLISGRTDQAVAATVTVLPDDRALNSGPVAGMATVLSSCPGQHCLFLPVDMVRVTAETLLYMARQAQPHAAHRESLFPLCLQADQATREMAWRVSESAMASERSVGALLRALGSGVNWVEGIDKAQLINANSPDDLKRHELPVGPLANLVPGTEDNDHD